MKQHWDICIGALVGGWNFILNHVNSGSVIFVLTATLLILRVRREWKFRNRPPTDREE